MTHRCSADRCPKHIDDVKVLCPDHAEIVGHSLHLALMAAQMRIKGSKPEEFSKIFDKRMAEAQLKINEKELAI